jgi:outer membrane protein assembly factor BamB
VERGLRAKGRLQFDGSRCVPCVLDDLVYTMGGFGQVTAFDRKTHEIAWSVDLQEAFGGELPMFGYSNSPLVIGERVIVTPLGEDIGLLALDRKTGEEAWFTETVGYSHSSPALLTLFGEPQLVFLSTTYQASGQDEAAPTTIWSFDPDDGHLLWSAETPLTRLPSRAGGDRGR